MKPLKELTRPNIWALKPYSSARDEYSGKAASVFLDANENPYNTPNNRYPDPLQKELKALIAPVKKVNPEQIFLGNGSDEAIDLLFRAFCRPEVDNVVAIHPTYGMYEVCADINDVEYRKVLLDGNFQFKAEDLLKASDENTKLMFLCSPNNPTGNNLDAKEIIALLQAFQGIVVIDEAYIDFSSQPSFIGILDEYPNLIILQTFSKAWGCAAIRLGMAFASPDIIGIFTKIKSPHPARSPAHDATPLRSATLGKHPVRRTRAPDGSFRPTLVLQEGIPHRCQFLPDPRDPCESHLRLLSRPRHHRAKPFQRHALRRLPPYYRRHPS